MSGDTNSWKPTAGMYVDTPDGRAKILAILGSETFACENLASGHLSKYPLGSVKPLQVMVDDKPIEDARELESYSDEEIEIGRRYYEALRPVLHNHKRTRKEVAEAAGKAGISAVTGYKYINRYHQTGTLTAFIPYQRGRKAGTSMLTAEQEAVLEDVILNFHFKKEAPAVTVTYKELKYQCRNNGIETPHINTLRNRIFIASIGSSRARIRDNKPFDKTHRLIDGDGEVASQPREGLMIDHTPADITLVSEGERIIIGRPNLTFCIDVYSRLITGYFVGFEPPGTLAVAMALRMSVLPKESLLREKGIDAKWPALGIPQTLYCDNAMEFRSGSLGRACFKYGIDIVQRPKGLPHMHGLIERNFRTQNVDIHAQPGTTKSNVQAKAAYDSESEAVMTLAEFDLWLTHQIIEFNHSAHNGIRDIPVDRYCSYGKGEGEIALGAPRMPRNHEEFFIDLLPYREAMVKPYGIRWDSISYRADVLRPWVNAKDPKTKKARKFIVRRDPRDLRKVYFLDPSLSRYFEVPYADRTRPHVTKWEWDEATREAKRLTGEKLDEDLIFKCYEAKRNIVTKAKAETKKARRQEAIKKTVKPPSIQPVAEAVIKRQPEDDDWDFDELDSFEVL